MVGRFNFNYRVIRWRGCDLLEEPAGTDSWDMAMACYMIAVAKHPDDLIALQQGIRVIRKSGDDD